MKQLELKRTAGWGGKRKGAGRPNLSGQVNHMKRPRVTNQTPLHANIKLIQGLPNLRTKALLKEFKESVTGAKKFGLYAIHFSIQRDHIHMIVEAENNKALVQGMHSLVGRLGKIIRAYCASRGQAKRGSVFRGRYFVRTLKTPTETRNALEYVLLNASKHQNLIEHMDSYSSASHFLHWKELLGGRFKSLIRADSEFWKDRTIKDECLSAPASWLAKSGWMKAKH